MSIPLLIECANETRRLAVAGSQLAVGDFRLQRLIEPLEKSGQKAAVFGAVAKGVKTLVEGSEKDSPKNLLDLSTLVNAILYTQGETGAKGTLETIETEDLGFLTNNTSARVMKPLIEALTTTGGGRHETIRDAYERGAFRDIRLIKLAVAGIDDVYSELADYMAKTVVPSYGKAIVPLIKDRVKLDGNRGDARRLGLLHELAPELAEPIAYKALEEKSSEIVKISAIEALAKEEKALPLLLEHAKPKGGTQDVRAAALKAIALHDNDEAVELLIQALWSKDIDRAAEAISLSKSNKLAKVLLEEARGQLTAILDPKNADAEILKRIKGREAAHFQSLLRCFSGRRSAEARQFLLDCFAERKKIAKLKGKGHVSGKDVVEALVNLLAGLGHEEATDALIDALGEMDEHQVGTIFVAAAETKTPQFVYDTFHTVLDGLGKKGKAKKKAEVLAEILSSERDDYYYWGYYWWWWSSSHRTGRLKDVTWDARWLDTALKLKHTGMVGRLVPAKHAKGIAFLTKALKAAKRDDMPELLEGLIRAEADDLVALAIPAVDTVFKKSTYYWDRWRMLEVVKKLPYDAVPELELLAQTLPDNKVDQLVDAITVLRRKAKKAGVKLPPPPEAPAKPVKKAGTTKKATKKAATKKAATTTKKATKKAAAKKKATKKKATKKAATTKKPAKKKAAKKKPAQKKATKKKAAKKKKK